MKYDYQWIPGLGWSLEPVVRRLITPSTAYRLWRLYWYRRFECWRLGPVENVSRFRSL